MATPDGEPPLIPYTPVAMRYRHDGWTAQRQIAFIEALAETACVDIACRRVGMSDVSAYRLRRSPRGEPFRIAWDAALDYAAFRLEQAAMSRALNGVARPIFYKGEQVGEAREFDERLTMFLLRTRRAARFGRLAELAPSDEPFSLDVADRLHAGLEDLAREADGLLEDALDGDETGRPDDFQRDKADDVPRDRGSDFGELSR